MSEDISTRNIVAEKKKSSCQKVFLILQRPKVLVPLTLFCLLEQMKRAVGVSSMSLSLSPLGLEAPQRLGGQLTHWSSQPPVT